MPLPLLFGHGAKIIKYVSINKIALGPYHYNDRALARSNAGAGASGGKSNASSDAAAIRRTSGSQ